MNIVKTQSKVVLRYPSEFLCLSEETSSSLSGRVANLTVCPFDFCELLCNDCAATILTTRSALLQILMKVIIPVRCISHTSNSD